MDTSTCDTVMKSVKKIFRDALIHGGLLQTRLSEDELKQVIDASSLSGTIDKTEHELIKSVLQFSDITAKEIMVRVRISWLSIFLCPGMCSSAK